MYLPENIARASTLYQNTTGAIVSPLIPSPASQQSQWDPGSVGTILFGCLSITATLTTLGYQWYRSRFPQNIADILHTHQIDIEMQDRVEQDEFEDTADIEETASHLGEHAQVPTDINDTHQTGTEIQDTLGQLAVGDMAHLENRTGDPAEELTPNVPRDMNHNTEVNTAEGAAGTAYDMKLDGAYNTAEGAKITAESSGVV